MLALNDLVRGDKQVIARSGNTENCAVIAPRKRDRWVVPPSPEGLNGSDEAGLSLGTIADWICVYPTQPFVSSMM